jgi:hypothetical protein
MVQSSVALGILFFVFVAFFRFLFLLVSDSLVQISAVVAGGEERRFYRIR